MSGDLERQLQAVVREAAAKVARDAARQEVERAVNSHLDAHSTRLVHAALDQRMAEFAGAVGKRVVQVCLAFGAQTKDLLPQLSKFRTKKGRGAQPVVLKKRKVKARKAKVASKKVASKKRLAPYRDPKYPPCAVKGCKLRGNVKGYCAGHRIRRAQWLKKNTLPPGWTDIAPGPQTLEMVDHRKVA